MEDLLRLKLNFTFSDKNILALANAIRIVMGKSSVVSGLPEAIVEKNRVLTDFFEVKVLPTVRKKGKEETIENKPGIFCKDLQALIHVLLDAREIDPERQEVLLGADDGQQSLKVRVFIFLERTDHICCFKLPMVYLEEDQLRN